MTVKFSTDPNRWLFKSQRQRVSPFPNYFSMETVCNDMKKAVGYNVSEILYFLRDNVHFMFMDKGSYERIARGVSDKIYQDTKLAKKLTNGQHKFGKILVDFTKKAGSLDLSKVSNQKLSDLFAEFEEKYKELYCRYGWVWIFEDYYIADLLAIVEKYVPEKNKAAEVLDILTKEPTAMVATVELKALLELGLKIIENKAWVELLKAKNLEEIVKEKELNKLVAKHVENYFWVTRDYEDPVLDFKTVINRLADYLSKNIKTEYKNLTDNLAKNELNRKKYLQEYNFTKEEVAGFESMREVTYLKELRKRYVSEALYYFDNILREIGKRLFLSLNQVRHLKTSEVKECLLKGLDISAQLNDRAKMSLWYCHEGQSAEIIEKTETEKLFSIFCAINKNAIEFTGMAVSPGVAQGPARIIMNPDECYKVQNGDIIVSVQVVPSFSTAIMRAAGLVCDGGHGITTHPATLAREAGIPGVIQTRYVREVVKDGDIIEVDGYKGVVKLIHPVK